MNMHLKRQIIQNIGNHNNKDRFTFFCWNESSLPVSYYLCLQLPVAHFPLNHLGEAILYLMDSLVVRKALPRVHNDLKSNWWKILDSENKYTHSIANRLYTG